MMSSWQLATPLGVGPELQLVYCQAGQEQEQDQDQERESSITIKGHERLRRLKGNGLDEYSFLIDRVGIFSAIRNLKVDKC